MAFGSLGSFNDVRLAVRDGKCRFAVNHFRPIQMARASERSKLLARLLYCIRFTVPTIVSIVLARTVYSSSFSWIAVLVVLLVSYIFDVRGTIVLIGLTLAAAGMAIHNNLLVLIGLPMFAAFICGLMWWASITHITKGECLERKSKFHEMWDAGLIFIVTDDEIHSVAGAIKRSR